MDGKSLGRFVGIKEKQSHCLHFFEPVDKQKLFRPIWVTIVDKNLSSISNVPDIVDIDLHNQKRIAIVRGIK